VIVRPVPTVTVRDAVAELLAESTTLAVNVAEPATGKLPERTPPLDKLNPTVVGELAPEVTLQV
jgi:hypothetical protein